MYWAANMDWTRVVTANNQQRGHAGGQNYYSSVLPTTLPLPTRYIPGFPYYARHA